MGRTPHLIIECDRGERPLGRAGPPSWEPADPDVGEIQTIGVDPEHFRMGAGRRLARSALAGLRRQGYHAAAARVVTENAPARRFYEAAGWRWDGASITGEAALRQLQVDRVRRLAPLRDRPDDQRGTPGRVAGREDSGNRGPEARVAGDRAARVELDAELAREAIPDGALEADGQRCPLEVEQAAKGRQPRALGVEVVCELAEGLEASSPNRPLEGDDAERVPLVELARRCQSSLRSRAPAAAGPRASTSAALLKSHAPLTLPRTRTMSADDHPAAPHSDVLVCRPPHTHQLQ